MLLHKASQTQVAVTARRHAKGCKTKMGHCIRAFCFAHCRLSWGEEKRNVQNEQTRIAANTQLAQTHAKPRCFGEFLPSLAFTQSPQIHDITTDHAVYEYVSSCESANSGGFSFGNQLTRKLLQGSSNGNLFVRVRFGGFPSTFEEVVRVRFSIAYLAERPTWATKAAQHLDSILPDQKSCVALRGFSLRGFWEVRGFSLLQWEKG